MTLDELLPSTEEEEKTGPVKEPSKRWRNRYRNRIYALANWIHPDDAGPYPAIELGDFIWPSREIAEQKAAEFMRGFREKAFFAYLGAFPVED